MDDWENWEEAAEKDIKEIKKDNQFADEEAEAVDIDAKNEVKITSQPKNADKVAKKEKASQLAKKWEEKEKQYDSAINDKKGPLTAEERRKAQQLSEQSDLKNTVDLFGGFLEQSEKESLKTEQAFIEYAKKVADILAKEERKKYIQEFMKELLQQVYPRLTSTEFEDIHSKCTVLFNQKQKEEKAGPGTKKKATQPKLNAAKGSNAAKLMDYDDEDDEEYVPRGRNDLYDDFM